VYPEGIWYAGVRPEDVAEIVQSRLREDTPVERLARTDAADLRAFQESPAILTALELDVLETKTGRSLSPHRPEQTLAPWRCCSTPSRPWNYSSSTCQYPGRRVS